MNRKKKIKINDPIHGFIIFPHVITKIVDSVEVQRLRRIKQLSGADQAFPGANHTRFEHSLGVASLAQRLILNLIDIHGLEFSQFEINKCIISALCHDIGHGPLSHNFESLLLEFTNLDHEDYTERIIENSSLGEKLDDLGFMKDEISAIATGKAIGKGNISDSIISQIITSAVNVDSMDYLLRDNYHCGTHGRIIDINRLLLSIDVLDDRQLGVDIKALIALEGYLLARISSFRTIYFHKTCRAVQLMITEAMRKISKDEDLFRYNKIEDYLKWDDYILWTHLIENPNSKKIMKKIQKRQLLKVVFESRIELTDKMINKVDIVEELAKEANIPIDMIYIDLPNSPNVPYSHIDETRPNIIKSFKRKKDNQKQKVRLEDYSLFFNQFKGQLKLLRIYTWPKYRNKLQRVAKKVIEKRFS